MASPTLINLPVEILFHICEILDDDRVPAPVPGLLAFAQTSKRLNAVAASVLFRTITFTVITPARLSRHTRECEELLRRRNAFRHVRRVVIHGLMEPENPGDAASDWEDEHKHEQELGNEGREMSSWHLFRAPLMDWHNTHAMLHGISLRAVPEPTVNPDYTIVRPADDTDTAWEPLANLIQQLPGLAEVIYESPSQFPPCLLRALHARNSGTGPMTRLHLHNLILRSLMDSNGVTGPHELPLATSPCLYCVRVSYRDPVAYDFDNRSEAEAVLQLIEGNGLAPNLGQVRLNHPRRLLTLHWPPSHPTPHFRNLSPSMRKEPGADRRAPLTNFEIDGSERLCLRDSATGITYCLNRRILSKSLVDSWADRADLSFLQTLKLFQMVGVEALQAISTQTFLRLTSLTFTCAQEISPAPEYYRMVKSFLRNLPGLDSLHLVGWDHSVESLAMEDEVEDSEGDLQSRSMKLKMLLLETEFKHGSAPDAQEIRRIAARFPGIEDLSVTIRRSRGDAAEVAKYKAIGQGFPKLRRLSLTLDASAPLLSRVNNSLVAPQPVDYDGIDPNFTRGVLGSRMPYHNGHVLDVLVNSAVDAKLARAIFVAVGSATLERMMVRATDGKEVLLVHFGQLTIWHDLVARYVDFLARAWLVEKNTTSQERDMDPSLYIRELSQSHLEAPEYAPTDDETIPGEPHFRRLWPKKPGSKGWWEDWESWPLEM
ncbi:hypothetical protein VTK56DRAFT_7767 [Thermocarpiscus australiensis]